MYPALVLAAAGSAVGLGNIWRFPYITGENGGGLFVLIYLVCIALVGLPILIGEIMLGRMTQTSVVGAFRALNGGIFRAIGYLGVAGAFLTGDFFNLYVWFEVMLVASFVLMALNRTRAQMEAAFKYVTINLIASSIFLTALGLLYGATGTLNMAQLARVWPAPGGEIPRSAADTIRISAGTW